MLKEKSWKSNIESFKSTQSKF